MQSTRVPRKAAKVYSMSTLRRASLTYQTFVRLGEAWLWLGIALDGKAFHRLRRTNGRRLTVRW
jgi:hypothetical protein